ncbi:hypothetical protein Cal6303_4172 [Calothrix sp. PCC 6303]|nr:hypothetical protein Cal6303_4172 [Calothrix sp. PCC 6303]
MYQYKIIIKNFISGLFIISFLGAGCLTVQLIISFLSYTYASTNTDTTYPTSLPWIETKSDCEHRGRKWQDNKCWDKEHNILF